MTKTVGIIGAGKIGRTLALMLAEEGVPVRLADVAEPRLPAGLKNAFERVDAADRAALDAFVGRCDAVVSSGPFRINIGIVEACAAFDRAYFDFTEDTRTTRFVQSSSAGKSSSFVPQCGLAPGMVNILAADLGAGFDALQTLKLRVGALPQTTANIIRYYLTWSTAGLVNEYCQPCDAIYRGEAIKTMPLEGLETIVIDGVEYEAFNTSGGVATMCESYLGKLDRLDYKTLRYPGHCEKMKFLLQDLELSPKEVEDILHRQLPTTIQDVVVIYVEATGRKDGCLRTSSRVCKILPGRIGRHEATAIEMSTAAGMAAVLELFLRARLPAGFVRQESISLKDVLETRWGREVYGSVLT